MKTIDATLLNHLGQPVTTTCFLAKVECQGAYAGQLFYFTNLDIDVEYDDGDGLATYGSDNGFTPKRYAATSGPSVDLSAIDGVITASGITEQMVRAGIFQNAKVTVYRVNYTDLTAGRHEVVAYGRAGQSRFHELGWSTEFFSLSKLLMQPIGEVYGIPCNARFGDARCKVAITWGANGTVSAVGTENDRVFGDDSRSEPDGYYSDHHGIVQWLTGDNAGIEMEIDVHDADSSGSVFELLMALPYPIAIGDTYRPRRDCDKLLTTCRDVYANQENHRGFPQMPVDGTSMVPGTEIDR